MYIENEYEDQPIKIGHGKNAQINGAQDSTQPRYKSNKYDKIRKLIAENKGCELDQVTDLDIQKYLNNQKKYMTKRRKCRKEVSNNKHSSIVEEDIEEDTLGC